jgi:hypothetical protein
MARTQFFIESSTECDAALGLKSMGSCICVATGGELRWLRMVQVRSRGNRHPTQMRYHFIVRSETSSYVVSTVWTTRDSDCSISALIPVWWGNSGVADERQLLRVFSRAVVSTPIRSVRQLCVSCAPDCLHTQPRTGDVMLRLCRRFTQIRDAAGWNCDAADSV